MRVLEVGSRGCPAEVFITDPSVEYVAVDPGIREMSHGESEAAVRRLSLASENGSNRVTFCDFDLESLNGPGSSNFDVVFLANVLGDPGVIPRDASGDVRDMGSAKFSFEHLCSRVEGGEIQVLEYYTPIDREILVNLFGAFGMSMKDLVEGCDLEDLIKTIYPSKSKDRLRVLKDEEDRRFGAKYWKVPYLEPYFASFIF